MTLLVRTVGDPSHMVPAVQSEIRHLNSDTPVFDIRTMSERIGATLVIDRMVAVLLGIFGGIALLLAVVGIYSVMSFVVTQRVREIGIRLALGSQTADVVRLVIGQGMKLVVIGVAFGLAISFALTRLVASLLFEVSATDPVTFAAIASLLMAVAALACYLPARRAAKVDPMVALRCE